MLKGAHQNKGLFTWREGDPPAPAGPTNIGQAIFFGQTIVLVDLPVFCFATAWFTTQQNKHGSKKKYRSELDVFIASPICSVTTIFACFQL